MLVEMFFGRIDARTASSETTGELIERFFPGAYELIRPGAAMAEAALPPPAEGTVRIVHSAEEERGALRVFLRALRKLPEDLDWEAVTRSDLVLLEWPERAGSWAPRPTCRVRLMHRGEHARQVEVT